MIVLIVLAVLIGGYRIYERGRPAPIPLKEQIFNGVTYRRIVRVVPHSMIVHVLIVDRRATKESFFVTPADHKTGAPLNARTTTQFMREFGVQIAVNGDGFFPWWSHTPADYYPHVGDPVTPNGFAAPDGDIYSHGVDNPNLEPTMYISRRGEITFDKAPGRIYNALSGDRMLVLQGKPIEGLDASKLNPRTAIGVNKNGRYVYLVVVDGRQPFYSEGATFKELAQLMADLGAYYAMNLDGGGSSTLVIQGKDGAPQILNSPVDSYLPGRQRPVANHFGIYLK
ncbi:MAG TPA: phosphodiester glycosidase family protein [Anaerolineales bacterium]|nr:phosphodiester glycosidase family protein [Anaerolineales bacterium]